MDTDIWVTKNIKLQSPLSDVSVPHGAITQTDCPPGVSVFMDYFRPVKKSNGWKKGLKVFDRVEKRYSFLLRACLKNSLKSIYFKNIILFENFS